MKVKVSAGFRLVFWVLGSEVPGVVYRTMLSVSELPAGAVQTSTSWVGVDRRDLPQCVLWGTSFPETEGFPHASARCSDGAP